MRIIVTIPESCYVLRRHINYFEQIITKHVSSAPYGFKVFRQEIA